MLYLHYTHKQTRVLTMADVNKDMHNLTDAQETAYTEFLLSEKNKDADLDMTLSFYDQFRYLLDSDQRDLAFNMQRAVMKAKATPAKKDAAQADSKKAAAQVKTKTIVTPVKIEVAVDMTPRPATLISTCIQQPLETLKAMMKTPAKKTTKRAAPNVSEVQYGFGF